MAATTTKARRTRVSPSSKAKSSDPPCPDCGWSPPSGGLWPTHGALAVRWIQDNLIFTEGDFFGRPFRLRQDQKLFLFEWYSYCGHCDRWRYDQALKGAATGDGKTEFVAAIACLEFAGPPQIAMPSPNIPIAAASFEQADLLFKAAATMLGGRDQEVKEAPLCGFFEAYDTEIKRSDSKPGRIFRVAAVAGTNEGGLPTLFVCDELHEWGDVGTNKARVHTVIGKSTKKRRTPRGSGRILNLSTAGFDREHSLLGKMYDRGKRILKDRSLDPRFLMFWSEARAGLNLDDPRDREIAVRDASKAADVIWSVRDRVAEWDRIEHHEWKRYYANLWVEMDEDSWLKDDPEAWDKCEDVDAAIPDQAEVVVAIDMALKRDSVGVLWAWKDVDRAVVRSKIWTPDDRKIDHLEVIDFIRHELALETTITEITYDPRFFEVPARMLEDEGFNMVEFPQSPERMAPACGLALEKIRAGEVAHDGDVDLSKHVKAAAKRPGERGWTLSKGKSKSQIDGAIALVIGLWRLFAPDPEEEEVEPWAAWV